MSNCLFEIDYFVVDAQTLQEHGEPRREVFDEEQLAISSDIYEEPNKEDNGAIIELTIRHRILQRFYIEKRSKLGKVLAGEDDTILIQRIVLRFPNLVNADRVVEIKPLLTFNQLLGYYQSVYVNNLRLGNNKFPDKT